jgi:hypothetical protein
MVAILEFVGSGFLNVLKHINNAGIRLRSINDDDRVGVFTIIIIDLEIYSVV